MEQHGCQAENTPSLAFGPISNRILDKIRKDITYKKKTKILKYSYQKLKFFFYYSKIYAFTQRPTSTGQTTSTFTYSLNLSPKPNILNNYLLWSLYAEDLYVHVYENHEVGDPLYRS